MSINGWGDLLSRSPDSSYSVAYASFGSGEIIVL